LNLYIGFIIASGVLYGVNLLLVNPVTCWLSLGLSLKKAETINIPFFPKKLNQYLTRKLKGLFPRKKAK